MIVRLIIILCAIVGALSCSDRQRLNPLDPGGVAPGDSLGDLVAMAGNGRVDLNWDYSPFSDIEGYILYRREGENPFVPLTASPLPPEQKEYVDESLTNGTTYEYRIGLLVVGEGERSVGNTVRATPGGESVWVADRGSGLVWKVNPDARTARFARGRFFDLWDIAVDNGSGACWVSDGGGNGLYYIDSEGTVSEVKAALEQPGDLALDSAAGIGWVADRSRNEVFWFSTTSRDSLEFFVVDASLAEPVSLAAVAGACWVVDRLQERAFLYSSTGQRIVEFRSLTRPSSVEVDADGTAWVLVRDGAGLARLGLDGEALEVALPFSEGQSLAVDRRDGSVWVVGEGAMAHFGRTGELIAQWEDVPVGRAIAVDWDRERTWVATVSSLWKFNRAGETMARLEGFSAMTRIEIDRGQR